MELENNWIIPKILTNKEYIRLLLLLRAANAPLSVTISDTYPYYEGDTVFPYIIWYDRLGYITVSASPEPRGIYLKVTYEQVVERLEQKIKNNELWIKDHGEPVNP